MAEWIGKVEQKLASIRTIQLLPVPVHIPSFLFAELSLPSLTTSTVYNGTNFNRLQQLTVTVTPDKSLSEGLNSFKT